MGYSEQVLRRARERLEQAKQERARENEAHRREAYERYPRLEQIDRELQTTMAQLVAATLRHGEDPAEAVAQIREKNLALQREREWILEAGDFEEGYLDDAPVCSKCGGSGYDGNRMCSCLRELCRQEQKKELTSLLGSGRESFDTFRLDVYSDLFDEKLGVSPRKLMQSNFNICWRYAQNFTPQSGNLLFSGATGLGKTFLSACVARVVSEDGFSVVYDTAGHVFARCEAAKFHADEEPDAAMDVRRFESCDLLILDDLGTEMATSFVQSALYQLVNGRLVTGKSTIISTNLTPVQISSRYGAAIWSRLQGEYTVLPFYGEDIRKLKRAMR